MSFFIEIFVGKEMSNVSNGPGHFDTTHYN